MFKVGDKVCDPIYGINGDVYCLDVAARLPVLVQFDNGESYAYTSGGFSALNELIPRLYHGHMEPGTGLVTFQPKKEPVYEWQWLVKKVDGSFMISAFREFSADYVKGETCSDGSIWHSRIEESKREVKS